MKNLIFFFAATLFNFQIAKAQASFTVSTQLCGNVITVLTASTGAMSNCSYTWSGFPAGINFSAVNNSVTNVSFSSAGSYSILLSIASGTTTSMVQADVDVFAPPVIALTASSYTTCITNNYSLATNPITLTASGGSSYTWNPAPNPAQAPANGPISIVTLTSATCFSVAGSNTLGCIATAVSCITITPQFTIAVTPTSTLICAPAVNSSDWIIDLTIIDNSNPPFGHPNNYSWSGNGLITDPFSKAVTAAPMSTSSFTAEAHDDQGCVSLPAIATISVSACTGLQNLTNSELILFYPNPVNDKLFISRNNQTSGLEMKLYNSLGQLVITISNTQTMVDLGDLPSGVYLLHSQINGQHQTNKIVKR